MLQTALLRHAGSHESVARDSSTDVRFVQSGTQLATPSPTARTPAILPPAKPMDEGVVGADVVEPVSSDVFASRVVTSVQPGRRSRRGRGSMAKVGSPGFLVATSWLVEEVLVKGATEEHGNEAEPTNRLQVMEQIEQGEAGNGGAAKGKSCSLRFFLN